MTTGPKIEKRFINWHKKGFKYAYRIINLQTTKIHYSISNLLFKKSEPLTIIVQRVSIEEELQNSLGVY